MNDKEPEPMRKIHAIRIRLWEREKKMTPEQRIKRSQETLERFVKENNLEHRVVSRTVLRPY